MPLSVRRDETVWMSPPSSYTVEDPVAQHSAHFYMTPPVRASSPRSRFPSTDPVLSGAVISLGGFRNHDALFSPPESSAKRHVCTSRAFRQLVLFVSLRRKSYGRASLPPRWNLSLRDTSRSFTQGIAEVVYLLFLCILFTDYLWAKSLPTTRSVVPASLHYCSRI